MPLETFRSKECMQGGELFDRSWPCKLVPSDFFVFCVFSSHRFFVLCFLPYSFLIGLKLDLKFSFTQILPF